MSDRSEQALRERLELAKKATPKGERTLWTVDGAVRGYLCIRDAFNEHLLTVEDSADMATAQHIAANHPDVVRTDLEEIFALRAEVARLRKRAERLRAGVKSLKSTVDFLVSNLADRIGEEKFDEMRRDALIKKLFDAGVCPENCDCGQVGKEERNYDSDESGCHPCWLLWSYDMARRECEKNEEDESA